MNIQHIDDTISVTGQITVADLDRIKAKGFKSVICARPDAEELGQPEATDIARAADAMGLTFVHIPVNGRPTSDDVAELEKHWPDLAKPVLGYCKSGMRANMLWSLLETTP
jgi:uncharacterized protein (TIGR01244 family)